MRSESHFQHCIRHTITHRRLQVIGPTTHQPRDIVRVLGPTTPQPQDIRRITIQHTIGQVIHQYIIVLAMTFNYYYRIYPTATPILFKNIYWK